MAELREKHGWVYYPFKFHVNSPKIDREISTVSDSDLSVTKVKRQRSFACKNLLSPYIRGKFGAMNDLYITAPGSVGITIKEYKN